MIPTEYEYLQASIQEVKEGLVGLRAEFHGNMISQGNSLSKVSQKLDDLNDRLFLDMTSAIPRLTSELGNLDKRFTAEVEKENRTCLDDRKEMREEITGLRIKMAYVTIVYGAGASIIITAISLGLRYAITGHF